MKKLSKMCFLAVFFFLGSCTGLKPVVKNAKSIKSSDDRLSTEVTPKLYRLDLNANPNDRNFSGKVIIDLELKSPQQQILLHAQDLGIKSVTLQSKSDSKPGTFSQIDNNGLAALEFGSIINPGDYSLNIEYEGTYQQDLSGLYRVKEDNNNYLYTQFEPLSARKMLPCFDEPRFKTAFEISVLSPKNLSVIASSPLIKSYDQGANTQHIFEKTAPISTYLLALAIGPFDIIKGPALGSNSDIPFRGIATKGRAKKMALAMRETPAILKALEDYFGIPYPFKKLDILAVPDFAAGAMENVGAITFRDWYLMLDKKSSVEQQQAFYEVMAHELAHQWFGNLVTMPWWDDLWLNESFATWLSYKIVDKIRPDFKLSQKLQMRAHNAMGQDSLAAVRKIREPIKTHHDIHNAFDSITYSKGGAVLSMFESYLGPDNFQKAVAAHIKRFRFGLASSKNFLESLAQTSDQLVKSADTFLNQEGVPTLALSYTCKKDLFEVQLSQERFIPVGSLIKSKSSWHIPVCLGYEENARVKKHCLMLDSQAKNIQIKSKTCPAFVMPNYAGQGYYRFSLNTQQWQNLINAPKKSLSENDRIAIADALVAELDRNRLDFALIARGLRQMSDADALGATKYFMNFIDEASKYWVDQEHTPKLKLYAINTLKPIYERLKTLRKLLPSQKILKGDIATFLAIKLEDPKTRSELSALGSQYLSQVLDNKNIKQKKIDENILGAAIGVSLQNEGEERLQAVIHSLGTERDATTRKYLLLGLSHAREGERAKLVRDLVFNPNLRKNEQMPLLLGQLKGLNKQPHTWSFLTHNLERFMSHLSQSQLGQLPFLSQGLCTNESADEVAAVLGPTISKYEGGPRNLAAAIEAIKICAFKQKATSSFANNFFAKPQVRVLENY